MSYIPSKRKCDLCQNKVGEGTELDRFVAIFYPLTEDEQRLLLEEFARLVGPRANELFAGLGLAGAVLPPGRRWDVCLPCFDNFMPMLDDLKQVAMDRILERMRERAGQPDGNKRKKRGLLDPEDDD